MAKLTSVMAIVGFVMVALFAMSIAATHSAPQPSDSQLTGSTMSRFVAYKPDNDPWTTNWLHMQADVQISQSLQSWFLYFYDPINIYLFNLNTVNFVANRGYFYDPSNPSSVYIYEVRPKSASVQGATKYFSNFSYFYCGLLSMEEYKSANLTHDRESHANADCQQVNEIIWSKGYFLTLWSWYASRNTQFYQHNLPEYKQYENTKFMYAGVNNYGVLTAASAYGRSVIVQSNSVAAAPAPGQSNSYATADITHYVYNMNTPAYGYVLPYDNQYFSVKSVGANPICTVWSMRTKLGFSPTMIKYTAFNTFYAGIPKDYTADGWIATCTVSAATQSTDATGRSYAWAPFRVHDIPTGLFKMDLPVFSTEYRGAQSDPWQNYQQNVVELSWY